MRKLLTSAAIATILGFVPASRGNAGDGYRVVGYRAPARVVYHCVAPPVVQRPVVVVPSVTVEETPAKIVQVDHRPLVQAGLTLQSHTLFLGEQPGVVFLQIGGVKHRCRIESWSSESASFTLPSLEVASEVSATIELARADGTTVKSYSIRLSSPPSLKALASPEQLTVVAQPALGQGQFK